MTRERFPGDALAFGERLINLLDEGRFVATYKYAVLLALMDLCREEADRSGGAPTSVTTRQLAEKVVEIYWPHIRLFVGHAGASGVLRQNAGGQAEIIERIARFRGMCGTGILHSLKSAQRGAYNRLVEVVEWKLIEMPLPRLQRMGADEDRFIYEYGWPQDIRRGGIRGSDFDNRLLLVGNAGEHLVQLAGLLRPLIYRQWARMVARLNSELIADSDIEEFLFGADRESMAKLRGPLAQFQDSRCFYCDDRLSASTHIDHFIPWARYPDNGVENLVAAHERCNAAKKAFLAAAPHVERWSLRFQGRRARDLGLLADEVGWERHPEKTLSVARSLYWHLAPSAKLWVRASEFADAELPQIHRALESIPE